MAFQLGVPDPGSGTDGVNWGPMDFAIVGVLVLGAACCTSTPAQGPGAPHSGSPSPSRSGAGLLLIWVNLAVGMIGDEGNAANLMYMLPMVVALIGAAVSRFEPREASIWMFATAVPRRWSS